jgi:hypothetical protein
LELQVLVRVDNIYPSSGVLMVHFELGSAMKIIQQIQESALLFYVA